MGLYYPQASMTLRILWEDFNFKSNAALQKAYSLPVMAKSVNVNINDYSSADTFEAEIDYKNFPFDPRCIRALGVTIHMQDVKRLYQGDNSLAALQRTVDNTIFEGYADEESISFDDSKRVVRIEGRDLTSLLLDRPYTAGPIALTDRLDVVLQNLLNQLRETATAISDPTQGLQLQLRGVTSADMPVLASFYGDAHQLSGHKNVDRHENYWEAIQDIVARAGLIAFVELDKLILTRPRALYDASNAKVFIYGNNIKNLQMKRKIGRKKTFNVIVRSLVGKEVVEAKIPAEATEAWSRETGIPIGEVKVPEIGPKGETVEAAKLKAAPYVSFRIPDCNSKDQLIKYAQEIYEEIGRQQIEGSFETKEMTTVTIGKQEFDVLKIRNGTPIQILVDQGDLKGVAKLSTAADRESYLRARGYDPAIAKAFAESMGKFADVFYTKSIRFTLDNENGFKASIEFLNFIDTKFKPPEAKP